MDALIILGIGIISTNISKSRYGVFFWNLVFVRQNSEWSNKFSSKQKSRHHSFLLHCPLLMTLGKLTEETGASILFHYFFFTRQALISTRSCVHDLIDLLIHIVYHTDYGGMMTKSLIIYGPKSYPKPKQIFLYTSQNQ